MIRISSQQCKEEMRYLRMGRIGSLLSLPSLQGIEELRS